MSKKPAGPKEQGLRQMREEQSGGNGNGHEFDYEAYANELTALREKHLGGVKARIQELQAEHRSIGEELNRLNEVEAKITGRGITATIRSGGGKRRRLSAEQKLETAKVIFGKLKQSKGNKFKSADLNSFADGIPVPELVRIWNESGAASNGEKIHVEGVKMATRYFLPA